MPAGTTWRAPRYGPRSWVGRRGPSLALAALTFAFSSLVGAGAGADPLPDPGPTPGVTVAKTPAAATCFDAPALAAAVEAKMRRRALEPTTADDAPFAIQIDREKKGYSATLRARGRLRTITDDGETCAGLEDALAITLAILLDAEAPRPAPPELAPPAIAARPPPPTPLNELPPNELPPPEPKRPRPPNLQLVGHFLITDGLTWPATPGFDVRGLLHIGKTWSLAVTFVDVPSRAQPRSGGQADVELLAGSVGPCARVLGTRTGPALSLCAGLDLGTVTGIGSGYTTNQKQVKPWVGAELDVSVGGPVVGPLLWSIRGGGVVPFVRETFEIEGGGTTPAFSQASIGGFAGAGLGLTIW